MSTSKKEKNKFQLTFLKLKPSEKLKNTISLPELPPASFLKYSENKTIQTRIWSDLADQKLKLDRSSSYFQKKSPQNLDSSAQSLLSTLGIIHNTTTRQLPKDLSKLKEMIYQSKPLEKVSLGSPATREDTKTLAEWLDTMLKTALSEQNNDIERLCETAMMIYEVCFHEIVRQVSVQCVERGELINKVWKAYLGILEKALRISQAIQEYESTKHEQECRNIHFEYKDEINKLKNDCFLSKNEVDRIGRVLKNKDEEISILIKREVRVLEKLGILQKKYENNKKDLLYMQEDNRIMKAKLFNSNVEYVENWNGVIEPKLINIQKIKKRDDQDILNILKIDPLLSAQMVSDEKTENLLKNIEKYEDFTKQLINQLDFIDKPCQTEIELKDTSTETDPELKIIRKQTEAKTVEVMHLKVESIMDLSQDSQELTETPKLETEKFLNKFQEKIDQVNALMEKMKQNIQTNIPLIYQKDLLNNFYRTVKDSVNIMKEEYEKEDHHEGFQRSPRQAKTLTYIHNNKPTKKPTLDLISLLTQKVLSTPSQKLKVIMIKKILLKTIESFYEIRMKKMNEGDKKQELGQLIIDHYYNRYGMPKVVESKFTQLLSSCIKYQSIKRVQLFGRFLKLFKNISVEDLIFYLDSVSWMKQTFYSENLEEQRISYEKALDWCKNFLTNKLEDPEKSKIKFFIENNKQADSLTKVSFVDVDFLLDYTIDIVQKKRSDNLDFLKSTYEAGDVSFI